MERYAISEHRPNSDRFAATLLPEGTTREKAVEIRDQTDKFINDMSNVDGVEFAFKEKKEIIKQSIYLIKEVSEDDLTSSSDSE